MKIGFVIPSRLKSNRLPKKVLLKFMNKTALEWSIIRAKSSKYIDEVVVATTGLSIDAEITKVCIDQKIRYYQGDPDDVLKRLRDTAIFFDFDYVVNITPDNILFSPYLIDLMVSYIKENREIDYCYFQNAMPGIGIYALKREALEIICEFKKVVDTEIWGPLFQKEYFNVKSIELPEFLRRDYRLTLDTPEDYRFIKKLYRELNISEDNLVELTDIIDFLDKREDIVLINSNVKQNSLSNEIVEDIKNNFSTNEKFFFEIKSRVLKNRKF